MTREKVTELYRNWRKSHGNKRPRFAIVRMYWEDEGVAFKRTDTISLKFYECGEELDEYVLWYSGGLKGLLQLLKPNNGSDFVVDEVLDFE